MSSYAEAMNTVLRDLAKTFIDGKGHFVTYDFSDRNSNGANLKRVFAELKAEGSIETDAGTTTARFTNAGFTKYKNMGAA